MSASRRSTPLSLLLLALTPCALAPSLLAQSKVVPPHLTNVEGESAYYFPFVYDKGRFQQIWDGQAVCAAVAVINQISFRRDTSIETGAYPAIVRTNTTVSLGTTTVSPATMTTTFATNLGTGPLTTLVNGVNFNLPALPVPTGVAPFSIHYPLTAPYLFLNAQGQHLLMEWIVPGSANNKDPYALDGETQTTASGYARPFGTFGKFAGGDQPEFLCDASTLVPGGAISLTASGLKQQYVAATFFGLSDSTWSGLSLPFDLGVIGANGSTLYTGRTIEVPMPLSAAKNGYAGQIKLPLPNNSSFAGYRIFTQTWFADAMANPLGLVTSNAIELTAGNGNPYSRILGDADSTLVKGSFEHGNLFGGPVTRFTGSIN